tara:strand:- start:1920 stop:2327 length:408 start_codon:yes stop_codon:yes gene_type:complete
MFVSFYVQSFFDDGSLVSPDSKKEMLTLQAGSVNKSPMMEDVLRSLVGMEVGETKQVLVSYEKAFGAYDPINVKMFPKSDFSFDVKIHDIIVVRNKGLEQQGVVVAVFEEYLEVDLNHPFSGRNLHVCVEIAETY